MVARAGFLAGFSVAFSSSVALSADSSDLLDFAAFSASAGSSEPSESSASSASSASLKLPLSTFAVCSRIWGSPKRSEAYSGADTNSVPNMPTRIPTNSDRDRSCRVPAPRMNAPMNKIAPTGRTPTIAVLIERTRVWFTAKLICSAKVVSRRSSTSSVFSRILSNTTTESYSE